MGTSGGGCGMRTVQAQFATRRGPGPWLWGIVLAGAAVAAGLQWQTHLLAEQRRAEEQAAEQRAIEQAAEAERLARAPLTFAESLNEIRQLREVQWPQLLAALEVTPRGELQVMSVEIDVVARSANLNVTAPSLKAVMDYAQELQTGTPEGSLAWRFAVARVTERSGGGVTAELRANWGTTAR
jgi:hypothetical protein